MDLSLDPITKGPPVLPELSGKGIVFVNGCADQLPNLPRVLKRVVGSVELRESLSDIRGSAHHELVAVNFDSLPDQEREYLTRDFAFGPGKPRLLLLSEGHARNYLASLFGAHTLTNMLVVNNKNVDICDFLVTIRKILKRDVFGLEKYFVWGTKTHSLRISDSTQRGEVLDTIETYCHGLSIPRRLKSLVVSVADEFVTNALYNAPVDEQGKPRYANRSRTEPVRLEEGEEVEIKFCCDGWRFGIATTDPFGTLTPELLLDYLAKCFNKDTYEPDESKGGAGLGFYHIFESLSHFIVNIAPGKRTEMIGLLDVSGSYRKFARAGKSFNLFVGE